MFSLPGNNNDIYSENYFSGQDPVATPVIPVSGKWKQSAYTFKMSFSSRSSFKAAWATRDPVSVK